MRDTPIRKGQKLRAKRVEEMQENIRRNSLQSGVGTLISKGPNGTSISASDDPPVCPGVRFWIRLTAAGTGFDAGKYAWTQFVRSGSSWSPLPITGTILVDYAIEANTFAALAIPCFVEVQRDPSTGRIVFQLEDCG